MTPSGTNSTAVDLRSGKTPETQTTQALSAPHTTPSSGSCLLSPAGGGGADRHDFDIFSREVEAGRVHWSVPWSDLMMTMFILFAVMYAFHSSKTGSAALENDLSADNDRPTIRKVYDRSQTAVRARNMPALLSVDLARDKAVRIVLTGDLLFASGSAELRQEGLDTLKELAGVLGDIPYQVHVIGHTDDQPVASPRFPSNWELSTARAGRVARYLTQDMGIEPKRFIVSGRGSQQPVRPNTTPENRASNRRVEIIVTRDSIPTWPVYPGTAGLSPNVREMTASKSEATNR